MNDYAVSGITQEHRADDLMIGQSVQTPDAHGPDLPRASMFGGMGRRLLVSILVFSSLLTLALTAFQLYVDYQQDVNAVEHRVEQIRGSYHDSLARSLWSVNLPQLRTQLEGIARLPDIRAASVQETGSTTDQPIYVAVGSHDERASLVWRIPLVVDDHGHSSTIGTLTIEGSLDEIVKRLANRALIILLSQGVKTFCVSFFILFLVYSLVTRHLVLMAHVFSHYDVRGLKQAQNLDLPQPTQMYDELQQMFDAFKGMQGKLERTYAELNQTNAALALDIAARIRAEDQATHLAYHEPLTGLANRRLLSERLDNEASLSDRLNRHGAVLLVNLDHFQRLNDALGHAVGDAVLLEVALRLSAAVRSTDLVASLGGDEFVLLLTGLADSAEEAAHVAHQVAHAVHVALATPCVIGEQSLHLAISIGVTLFPTDGSDAELLLKNVDTALHHAKTACGNCTHFFQPEMQASAQAHHQMENDLRQALIAQQFSLVYQPQVDRFGNLLGAEALIRWQHPERGAVSPTEFIPVAEESTLILDIGAWVLATALEQLRIWSQAGLLGPDFSLAINVSPRQFRHPDFVQGVEQHLQGLANPRWVTLEITEGMLVGDADGTVARIKTLRDLGVQFHIDDFGTGYSSMSYLKRLPVDAIKIDQSFVRDMLHNPADTAIVEAMLAVAASFHLGVIAEGVETEEQLSCLSNLGCAIFQGYFFSRPVPAEKFAGRYLLPTPSAV
jgi:diguanylate cyclase (GGDEF)-like protein